ncbi:MAG TPA: hypothetical protein ENH78_15110 [Phycisphaerae bacterium]|nr:hypothetical protein [Phycisphaerae bacterium]
MNRVARQELASWQTFETGECVKVQQYNPLDPPAPAVVERVTKSQFCNVVHLLFADGSRRRLAACRVKRGRR